MRLANGQTPTPEAISYPRARRRPIECDRYLFLSAALRGRKGEAAMSLVRAIEIYDAYRGAGAGVRLGTSRVRWAIESAVAAVFEVGIEELRAPTRGSARAAFARQVAMYLAHVGCGVSLTEVGRLFERDRTTVAHACGLIEDKRDDPDFDYRLDHLERAVSCLIDALSMRQGRR